jgi:hypothetical protein
MLPVLREIPEMVGHITEVVSNITENHLGRTDSVAIGDFIEGNSMIAFWLLEPFVPWLTTSPRCDNITINEMEETFWLRYSEGYFTYPLNISVAAIPPFPTGVARAKRNPVLGSFRSQFFSFGFGDAVENR